MAMAGVLLLLSCLNVKYVTIEQMTMPEVVLPSKYVRVAVLNNLSPCNITINNPDLHAYSCSGDSVMDYVAQALADVEVFGEVVVWDTCLFVPGDTAAHVLSQREVVQLCDTLDVDMLYVCDYACVTSCDPDAWDADEINYYLAAHIYVPSRAKPLHAVIYDGFLCYGILSKAEQVAEALSDCYPLIGDLAAQAFVTHWEPRERSFYSGPSYDLREATVAVRDGDWEEALTHWQNVGESKSAQRKMAAFYNQALAWEMIDSIPAAYACLDRARTFVSDTTAVDSAAYQMWTEAGEEWNWGEYPFTPYQRIENYRRILHEREAEIQQLNILNP